MPHFDWQSHKAYARHRIELVAFGDGAESTRVVIEYEFNDQGGVHVERAERPADESIMRLGLMSLISGLPDEDHWIETGDTPEAGPKG
jgi:hypothetical protein